MFSIISRLFLRWMGAIVYSQTGWGTMAGFLPLDLPLREEALPLLLDPTTFRVLFEAIRMSIKDLGFEIHSFRRT